jgi:hypothetical protein
MIPGGSAATKDARPSNRKPSNREIGRRNETEPIFLKLVIGSGPIVIGQGCEFDYSGVQACKALREEGYEVVLVNSNPATIMTDPEFADRTYIEPITPEMVEKIIIKESRTCSCPRSAARRR